MSLKFTEDLCVMTINNDGKFGEKLTCRFIIETLKSKVSKISTLRRFSRPKYMMFELKRSKELCLIDKIDAKFGGKLTCAFKNDMRNLTNIHRLKNSGFILESKIKELNQNKNSKQLYRPDAGWKLYFSLEIKKIAQLTKLFTYNLQNL